MYVKASTRKTRDGQTIRYLQLAHNEWDPAAKVSKTRVLYSFGREDQLDVTGVRRLVDALSRLLDPADALAVATPAGLSFVEARPLGGAWLLDGLWRRLGIDTILGSMVGAARREVDVERVLFALVANRALKPSSKLAAADWVCHDVHLPGLSQVTDDACYRAMDQLIDVEPALTRAIYDQIADLLNLEVDLLFFDTTSTYFELDEADDLVWRDKHGKMVELAQKSIYNPKTKKYFGLSDSWVPDPGNYRKDLWDAVGTFPDTWDDVRIGGAKIKQQSGNPVGIGLSQELDTSMAMRAIMYSFGSHEQDEDGQLTINSKETLEAVKFVRALYQETMTPEVFTWDVSSNNRFMLAGKGSFAMNAISITRSAEKDVPEMSKKIQLAKTPAGPVRRMGLEHVMSVYVIWKFSENKEGAKQFLLDLVDHYRTAFLESEFYNFPSFPKTVPDLQELIAKDPKGEPPDKYSILGDFINYATNVGYPGYSTAAIDEVFSTFVIPTMFGRAARDEVSPEDAIKAAEREMKRIFAKWEKA